MPSLDNQRATSTPNDLISGMLAGATEIRIGGSKGIKVDGKNNAISITDATGRISGFGVIPDNSGDFGFFNLDETGTLVLKIVGGTKYVYNPKDAYHNVTQDGLLPDGSGGFISVKAGNDVANAYL